MSESEKELTVDEVLELMQQADTAMRATLGRMLTPRARREGGQEHREQLRKLLSAASPHHVRDVMLHRMAREKMYVGRSLSFMSSIVAKTEVARLGGPLPGWTLQDKQRSFEFMDLLDIRRPDSTGAVLPFAELDLLPGTVVKPAQGSGSMGCYWVFAENEVVHVKDGKVFTDRESLHKHAFSVLRDKSSATSASRDKWLSEELILSDNEQRQPAVDLKFWTFYGKVAFVSEINRHPEVRWDFWGPDGQRIEAPGGWKITRHEGQGFDPEHLKIVERISTEIPYPFMRIDMLRGDGELVFGELTPRPGSSNVLTREWDRRMGEMWGLAENRLQQDLIKGKAFSAYKLFMDRSRRRRKAAQQAKRSSK